MKLGKVSETILRRSLFKQLHINKERLIVGAGIGADCAILKWEEECCVFATNTLTYRTRGTAGLLVHNIANNLATRGAITVAIELTLLLPEYAREIQMKQIVEEVSSVCKILSISIIGGSTEVSDSVVRPILSATGVGKLSKEEGLIYNKIKVGQELVMTKWIGLQGTSLLARLDEKMLNTRFSGRLIEKAKSFDQYASVLIEATIGKELNVSAMHDLSKGGIFQGLWEFVRESSFGLEVDLKKISIQQETVELCEYYNINPYELDSGGALLLATNNGRALVERLKEVGIVSSIIGITKEGNDKIIYNDEQRRCLEACKCDEYYKAIRQIEEREQMFGGGK